MRKTFMSNAEIMQRAEAEIAATLVQIRRDTSRTDDYKKAEIAKAYQQMRAVRDRLVEERNAARDEYRRTLERDIFAGQGASDPSWAISRRDAGDRAEQLESPTQAAALLARAERQGDEPLARAIAERAYEMRWPEVADQFLGARPDVAPRFQELWEHAEPSLQQTFMDSMALQARPAELDGVPDYEIDRLADSFSPEPAA
ncbi:hypothetical protein [uncultured Nocardioides sp.]|uniref:hypothetical protein n=1 Tax=uncultured Nocardioides sp. TaxID=198441 RepID=UPI00260D98CA|nr:hypothetical protein [uncultured Nocardioides sp.]